jgi:hypothetical protein
MLEELADACKMNDVLTVAPEDGDETVTVTAEAVVIKESNNSDESNVRMRISASLF